MDYSVQIYFDNFDLWQNSRIKKQNLFLKTKFIFKMSNKSRDFEAPHAKVRMLLRQVGLDQIELSKKLNLSEPVVSSALNGKNEKSFQRIVDLLIQEYNFTYDDIYQQNNTVTQMIQEGLNRIESRLDQMQEMIKRMEEKLKWVLSG